MHELDWRQGKKTNTQLGSGRAGEAVLPRSFPRRLVALDLGGDGQGLPARHRVALAHDAVVDAELVLVTYVEASLGDGVCDGPAAVEGDGLALARNAGDGDGYVIHVTLDLCRNGDYVTAVETLGGRSPVAIDHDGRIRGDAQTREPDALPDGRAGVENHVLSDAGYER